MMSHACNPSIWEVEAGGLEVQGQLGYIILCPKKQKQKKKQKLFMQKLLEDRLYVTVILVVQLAMHFQHSSAFTEEPGKTVCSPPWPLLQLQFTVGSCAGFPGMDLVLFLPRTLK